MGARKVSTRHRQRAFARQWRRSDADHRLGFCRQSAEKFSTLELTAPAASCCTRRAVTLTPAARAVAPATRATGEICDEALFRATPQAAEEIADSATCRHA